ncbi:MAG: hypothetical protein RL385_1981 [Pseudomonadota bacterium]|jgi:RNA polymerase sigma-70 factor (ECF subfamily)
MERQVTLRVVETAPQPLAERDDDALMMLAAAGRSAAFAQLVIRHSPALRAYCTRQCGSPQGDDVAQEVFVAVFKGCTRYVPEGRFRAYLFTAAARRCKNAQRNRRVQDRHFIHSDHEAHGEATSLDGLLTDERRRRLHEAIAELPEPQRNAIWLRFNGGLDYAEVAAVEGCPEPTARTRVHAGLEKLRRLWEKRGAP